MTPTEQYQKVCKQEFQEIKGMIKDVHSEFKEVNRKLFVGNGQPPHSVQLDRLNRFMKISVWFFGVITVAGVGIVAKLIHGLIIK